MMEIILENHIIKLTKNYFRRIKNMADMLETLKCPACGAIMEKVFIPKEGINIDICLNGCGGIFFDNREFDKFNEANEDITVIEEKYKNKNFKPVNENAVRTCPACGSKMVKNTSAINGKVYVDDCYVCGGKFLDYGELLNIRKEFATDEERGKAAMSYLFKQAGSEIERMNAEAAQRKQNRSNMQKFVYSLLDIKE